MISSRSPIARTTSVTAAMTGFARSRTRTRMRTLLGTRSQRPFSSTNRHLQSQPQRQPQRQRQPQPPNGNTLSTRITDLFGCDHPIVLPGMSWISTPELVAAVSNAGGVGILATGPLSACETRESIRRTRELLANNNNNNSSNSSSSDAGNKPRPFGVGVTLLMPGARENAIVALEEEVPIINVSLGKARWIRDGLDGYGGKLLATVTNREHASRAIGDGGADALMVTGHEAAAHGGDVTSLVLVPSLAREFPDTPLVAAGGFANGRGLHAALALGADAVAMGSRMATTKESPLAEATKEAIVGADESHTIYGSNFDGIPARVLATDTAGDLMRARPWLPVVVYRAFAAARFLGVPVWKVLPGLLTQWNKMFAIAQFGAATEAIMAATVDGDLQRGVQFVGQCQGMIDDVPSVEDLVHRILEEAREVHEQQMLRYGYGYGYEHGYEHGYEYDTITNTNTAGRLPHRQQYQHPREEYYPFE